MTSRESLNDVNQRLKERKTGLNIADPRRFRPNIHIKGINHVINYHS